MDTEVYSVYLTVMIDVDTLLMATGAEKPRRSRALLRVWSEEDRLWLAGWRNRLRSRKAPQLQTTSLVKKRFRVLGV